ncbi:hypothetical protein EDD28_0656 [Salana multivorans]|uniref:Secreted protein n=1 Tax=Salana multivorans TaxID=120377 RepID=A0A3N2D8Q3_9MICO|nr:hypothetical protein [Salana multivorans]ROR96082.1 hypothetical protein EDD28_0656 [Salana multivorans]
MYARTIATTLATTVLLGLGASAAQAHSYASVAEHGPSAPGNGTELDPDEVATVVTETYDVMPGGGTVGSVYETDPPSGPTPFATWGSSYAISTETAWLYYKGRAKAAGNVFQGQRIVKVCIWYSQGSQNISGTVCSSASSNGGSWIAGAEKSVSAWDNLSVNWPQTRFNIETTRINPNIY